MIQYVIKRLLQTFIVLIGVTLVTFMLLNIVPGDPILMMLGQRADQETVERVRHEWGLDRPLPEQYVDFVSNAIRGDFGNSYYTKEPVTQTIFRRLVPSAKVAGLSYLLAIVVGIAIGIVSAINRGKPADRILMSCIVLFMSAPAFWVGMILQIIFGLKLKWLPISGLDSWKAYILPCITLGLRYAATTARFTRTAMLDVIGQDYVRTARAKGLKENIVISGHALKNALIPIVTMSGMQLGGLMSGAMLTETVFNIHGMGKLTVDSMLQRDMPLLQGCVVYLASIFVMMNLIVDLLYAVIDPRIRVSKKAVA